MNSSFRCLRFNFKWNACFRWTFFKRQFLVPVLFFCLTTSLLFLLAASSRCHVPISVRLINDSFRLNTAPSWPWIVIEYFFLKIITNFNLFQSDYCLNQLFIFFFLVVAMFMMMMMASLALLIFFTIRMFMMMVMMMMMFMMFFAVMTVAVFWTLWSLIPLMMMVSVGGTTVVMVLASPRWVLVDREAAAMRV